MPANSPSLLTTYDLARRYGVSVATIRRWVRQGRVPFIRASRRVVRFDLVAVENALTKTIAREGDAC